MTMNILWPWKMCGKYKDDFETIVGGYNEEDCMYQLINLANKHGDLIWYSGYFNEDYEAGEYIGRDNFV